MLQRGNGAEHEIQILDIDTYLIKTKLDEIGRKVHERKKYIVTYFYSPDSTTFIRIRDENGIITLTKKILSKTGPADEYEIKLSSDTKYKDAVSFASNIVQNDYRKIVVEKYRTKWEIPGKCHEIALDEWPGIPEYLEIECNSPDDINDVVKNLELSEKKQFTRGAFDIYTYYYGMPDRLVLFNLNLQFSNIGEVLKKYVTKNENELINLQNKYNESPHYK